MPQTQSRKIVFEVEQADIVDEKQDSQFATAKLRLFSSGKNRNGMFCSEENLIKTADSAYEKPVIFSIDSRFGDFANHDDGNVPAGFIVPGSKQFVRLPDSRLSLEVAAKIWKRYSGKFLETFKSQDKTESKLSVEMELFESDENSRPDGLVDMLDFAYSAACILGERIVEGSPSAQINILSFSEIEKEYKKDFKKEFSTKYEEANLDFTIPEEMKKSSKKGLELHKIHNRGGNSVSLSVARHIINSDKIDPNKLRRVAKHFKKTFDNISDKESNDYISCELFGGSCGKNWAMEMIGKMDEIDSQRMSFFSDSEEVKNDSIEKEKEVKNSMDKKEDLKDKEEVKPETEMSAEVEAKTEEMAAKPEKDETPADEAGESPDEEAKEKKEGTEQDMSLDAYLDTAYVLAWLQDETEQEQEYVDEEMTEEFSVGDSSKVNWAKVAKKMFAVCQKMAAKKKDISEKFAAAQENEKAYMAENMSLKEFKEKIEKNQFSFEVNTTLKEITTAVEIPTDVVDNLKEQSLNFSMSNVDAWKNVARAKAFEYKAKISDKKDGPARYAINNNGPVKQENSNGSVW